MCTNRRIIYTDEIWDPITGCSKISPGCKNCFAEKSIIKLQALGFEKYKYGFDYVLCHYDYLVQPFWYKRKRSILVSSTSDIFHEDVPDDFIEDLILVMNHARRHTFLITTKRSERLRRMSKKLTWTPNIWMGVSVEDNDHTNRIEDLLHTGASRKFISFEPLLGPITSVDLMGIDWVIVGGELGPNSIPMKEDWIYAILADCQVYEIPFLFKQWGGPNKNKYHRQLHDSIWDEVPHPFCGKTRYKF